MVYFVLVNYIYLLLYHYELMEQKWFEATWQTSPVYMLLPIENYYDHTLILHKMIYIYDMTLSFITGVLLRDTIVNLDSLYTVNTIFICLHIML